MSGINNSVASKNILTAISNLGNGGSNAAAAKNATSSATSKATNSSTNSTNNTHMVGNSGKSQDLTAGASQRTSAQVENTSSSTLDQAAPDIANRINGYVMPSDMNALSNDISNLNAALQSGGGVSSELLNSINNRVNHLQDIVQSVLTEIPSESELKQQIDLGSSIEAAEYVKNLITETKENAEELRTIASTAEFKKKYNNLGDTIADLLEQSKQEQNQSQLKSHAGNQNKTLSGGPVVKPQSILSFTEADNLASNMNLGAQVAVMLSMFTSISESAETIAAAATLSQLQQSLAQLFQNVIGLASQFSSIITNAFNSYVAQAAASNGAQVDNLPLITTNPTGAYNNVNPWFGGVLPLNNPSGTTTSNQIFWQQSGSLANPAFLYYLLQNSLVCVPGVQNVSNPQQIVPPNNITSGMVPVQNHLVPNQNAPQVNNPPFSNNNFAAVNGNQVYFLVGCGIGGISGVNQNMINLPPTLFNMLPPGCVLGTSGSSAPQTVNYLVTSGTNLGYGSPPASVSPGSVAYVSLSQFMTLCDTVLSAVSIITPITSDQSLLANVFGQSASESSVNDALSSLEQAGQTLSASTNQFLQLSQQTTQNLSNQLQLVQTIIQNFRVQSTG